MPPTTSERKNVKSRGPGRPMKKELVLKKCFTEIKVKTGGACGGVKKTISRRGRPISKVVGGQGSKSSDKPNKKKCKPSSEAVKVKCRRQLNGAVKRSRSNTENQMSLAGGTKSGPGHSQTALVVASTSFHNDRKGEERKKGRKTADTKINLDKVTNGGVKTVKVTSSQVKPGHLAAVMKTGRVNKNPQAKVQVAKTRLASKKVVKKPPIAHIKKKGADKNRTVVRKCAGSNLKGLSTPTPSAPTSVIAAEKAVKLAEKGQGKKCDGKVVAKRGRKAKTDAKSDGKKSDNKCVVSNKDDDKTRRIPVGSGNGVKEEVRDKKRAAARSSSPAAAAAAGAGAGVVGSSLHDIVSCASRSVTSRKQTHVVYTTTRSKSGTTGTNTTTTTATATAWKREHKCGMLTSARRVHGRRRVASLNAIAMVHVLYESDTLRSSDDGSRSSTTSSDSEIVKVSQPSATATTPAKNVPRKNSYDARNSKVPAQRKRKSTEESPDCMIDTRYVKRLASLNAQAIMAASCNPPKKRQKRVKVTPDTSAPTDAVIDTNNNRKEAASDSLERQFVSVDVIDDDDDDICIVSVDEPMTADVVSVNSSPDTTATGTVYNSPPPPYHTISKDQDYVLPPPSSQQQQHGTARYLAKLSSPPPSSTVTRRSDDFSTCCSTQVLGGQRVNSLQNQAVVTGQTFDNVAPDSILGHQFGNQFHASGQAYNQHSSVPYAHNFYQPAGPLLQAVTDHFNMIHKPVPYHPHQYTDLQHQMTASHAAPFLTQDSCHGMPPALHPLQSCIPDKCQNIHHVPRSPPYNQMPSEVPSMPPRLQPLRTAQQHIAMNKNDNYTYPPPPILPQPQYNPCQPYPRTYQSRVLPDYTASSQQIQSYRTSLPPPSMNISSESFVAINQSCPISKQEHVSSNAKLMKQYQLNSHQQFNIKQRKKDDQKASDMRKVPLQKIARRDESKCAMTVMKAEYCNNGKPKSHPIHANTDFKSFVGTSYPPCINSKQPNFLTDSKSPRLQLGVPTREQFKVANISKMSQQQQPPPQEKCSNKLVKVKKGCQNQNKKVVDVKKLTVNKKKVLLQVPPSPCDLKVKKICQSNQSKNTISSSDKVSTVKQAPVLDAKNSNTKKVKTKKLCEGWNWNGESKKKLVYLNNEDGSVMRTCYPAIQHFEGDIICERDSVLVCSGARKTDIPYVAKVSALWESPEDGEMMMSLLWYYRPEQTEHGRKPHHIDQEIFASKHRDFNSVACIEDKCYVITYGEYCRYRAESRRQDLGFRKKIAVVPDHPSGYNRAVKLPSTRVSPDRIFVCRRVYDYRQKRCLKNPV